MLVSLERGATSVVARTDYWRAALKICVKNPSLGTGTRNIFKALRADQNCPVLKWLGLCHNDYLEQASDSGILVL
jgi:O-antigen ligase